MFRFGLMIGRAEKYHLEQGCGSGLRWTGSETRGSGSDLNIQSSENYGSGSASKETWIRLRPKKTGYEFDPKKTDPDPILKYAFLSFILLKQIVIQNIW